MRKEEMKVVVYRFVDPDDAVLFRKVIAHYGVPVVRVDINGSGGDSVVVVRDMGPLLAEVEEKYSVLKRLSESLQILGLGASVDVDVDKIEWD